MLSAASNYELLRSVSKRKRQAISYYPRIVSATLDGVRQKLLDNIKRRRIVQQRLVVLRRRLAGIRRLRHKLSSAISKKRRQLVEKPKKLSASSKRKQLVEKLKRISASSKNFFSDVKNKRLYNAVEKRKLLSAKISQISPILTALKLLLKSSYDDRIESARTL